MTGKETGRRLGDIAKSILAISPSRGAICGTTGATREGYVDRMSSYFIFTFFWQSAAKRSFSPLPAAEDGIIPRRFYTVNMLKWLNLFIFFEFVGSLLKVGIQIAWYLVELIKRGSIHGCHQIRQLLPVAILANDPVLFAPTTPWIGWPGHGQKAI